MIVARTQSILNSQPPICSIVEKALEHEKVLSFFFKKKIFKVMIFILFLFN